MHDGADPRTGRPRTILGWHNAVVERRGGEDIAYIPRCGFEPLDGIAAGTGRSLGHTAHPSDCRRTILQGSGVRCLTNDLRLETARISSQAASSETLPSGP